MDLRNFSTSCRKIIGVGLNYKKMITATNAIAPTSPILFMKATSSIITEGSSIKIPLGCKDVNHEVELGVLIGEGGRNIKKEDALEHIGGYALTLDMTSGKHFQEVRANSQSWALAKNWDTFLPVSNFIPKECIANPDDVKLWLTVDGELKQNEYTSDMLFDVPTIISYISEVMTLNRGDLIITGSPNGVGPVTAGQLIKCGIGGVEQMEFKVE